MEHYYFQNDGWPLSGGIWEPRSAANGRHLVVGTLDDALLARLKGIESEPFLPAREAMHDERARPYKFAYVSPHHPAVATCSAWRERGRVIFWSTGTDGVDQLGCSDGGCLRNDNALARGLPSAKPSDDEIVLEEDAVSDRGDAVTYRLKFSLRRCGAVRNW